MKNCLTITNNSTITGIIPSEFKINCISNNTVTQPNSTKSKFGFSKVEKKNAERVIIIKEILRYNIS